LFQVKVLYVRNLQLSTTEETIERIFSQYGEVERVKKLRDYCFVHFKTREEARKAINAMKGTLIMLINICVDYQQKITRYVRCSRSLKALTSTR
jgi:hypothetical protein